MKKPLQFGDLKNTTSPKNTHDKRHPYLGMKFDEVKPATGILPEEKQRIFRAMQ